MVCFCFTPAFVSGNLWTYEALQEREKSCRTMFETTLINSL